MAGAGLDAPLESTSTAEVPDGEPRRFVFDHFDTAEQMVARYSRTNPSESDELARWPWPSWSNWLSEWGHATIASRVGS